ncbi:hypothetical protein KSS87_004294 [Heliosperma pusillum]|nr:hypothetical protein KSS87_004294 [Heliosperma pusillum]
MSDRRQKVMDIDCRAVVEAVAIVGASMALFVGNLGVDHHDPENMSILRFNALWESNYRHDSLLVFSTGRSPTLYKELRKEKPMLTPDITIMSVGTEITYGKTMVPDDGWVKILNQKWDRNVVIEEAGKFSELKPQAETEQRAHKISFYVEKEKAQEVTKVLAEQLEKRGLDVKIIYSGGIDLDILPQGAGKGQALAYLLKKFKSEGKPPTNTLVCGDSGNDAELFSIPDVHGVMVSNAQEELLQWFAQNGKGNPKIIHATERCAAGIIQAIGHFGLGPNISPRDVVDFNDCPLKCVNPGHEIVKFYLFYERWRRGEVDNSEAYYSSLKSVCHPLGVFIHPSGQEFTLHECIDTMRKCYGDRQGTRHRVWIDRLLPTRISNDAWLVRFDKWELSAHMNGGEGEVYIGNLVLRGEELHCCVVTTLLRSKAKSRLCKRIAVGACPSNMAPRLCTQGLYVMDVIKWSHNFRGYLIFNCNIEALAFWNERTHLLSKKKFTPPKQVVDFIRGTQFYGTHRLSFVPMDADLITALVERWRQETHTFHFPIGEVGITLQDVNVLLGLKVGGLPITGNGEQAWMQLFEHYLGIAPPKEAIKGNAIKLSWLIRTFKRLPDPYTEQQLHYFVRTYLLYLIGAVLFPDKSGNLVQFIYFQLLTDLTRLSEYSWGSGVLAYLYRNLCVASKKGALTISGCLVLLQLWSWERLTIGRPTKIISLEVSVPGTQYPLESQMQAGIDPLGFKWLRVEHIYIDHQSGLVGYRHALDSMTESMFTWQPYTQNVLSHLPRICSEDVEEWIVKAHLICFEIVE